MNATFQWITGAGETPTEKTGPSYDHSTLSKDGKRRNEMFLLRRKTNNISRVNKQCILLKILTELVLHGAVRPS